MTDHPLSEAAATGSEQAVLRWRKDDTGLTVTLNGMNLLERALLQVGSERSAIAHARRFYNLDAKTARLLVRCLREGREADRD